MACALPGATTKPDHMLYNHGEDMDFAANKTFAQVV